MFSFAAILLAGALQQVAPPPAPTMPPMPTPPPMPTMPPFGPPGPPAPNPAPTQSAPAAAPTATPTPRPPKPPPNPFRLLQFGTPTIMTAPVGHIRVLGGWVAVRRDARGAEACVSFENAGTVVATRVVFEFPLLDYEGAPVGKLRLDRRGTFSPGIAIHGWDNLTDWQTGQNRGYQQNCTNLDLAVAAFPLFAARFATYHIVRVEYASGAVWVP